MKSEGLLPLRPVEFHILLSLTGGDRHGYIIQDAREPGAAPDIGTPYSALARMVDRGLIEVADSRSAPDADDERRNYYRITDAGLRVAKAEARRMGARSARIGGLLGREAK